MVGCNSGRATPFLRRNRPSAIPNHQPRRNATYHSREAVQTTEASSFGLFDMHGNVWQWVEDCYHESYNGAPQNGASWTEDNCESRVRRGGSWWNNAAN